MFRVNPPVPVQVKPVAVAIDNTVAAAVVLVSAMFPDPKVIERVLVLEELKIPVLKVKPARSSVPSASVVVFVIPSVNASASVTVIPVPLTPKPPRVLPLLVNVVETRNVGSSAVYVPPEASVKLPAMFKLLHVTAEALPVNITVLNQLLLVMVSADEPALTVRLGAFDTDPDPPVPKVTVAVAA